MVLAISAALAGRHCGRVFPTPEQCTLQEPARRAGDNGNAAPCCYGIASGQVGVAVEQDRALLQRCLWAGGIGCTSFLEVISTQSWQCPSSPIRSVSVPPQQSCAARSLSPLHPAARNSVSQPSAAFPQHLVSEPARGAQPPTLGVFQVA